MKKPAYLSYSTATLEKMLKKAKIAHIHLANRIIRNEERQRKLEWALQQRNERPNDGVDYWDIHFINHNQP